MAWLLETASGKFIDNFGSRAEAETARKRIGIVGCKVRQGKVPMTRILATQIGGVQPQYQSVDAFVDYLAEDDRTTYTTAELNKLIAGTHMSRSVLLERLRAKNVLGELHKKPVRPPPRPPPVPAGWKKPLAKDESERTKAKRLARARTAVKVPLEQLTENVIDKPIDSLNKTQQARKKAFVDALATRHLEILLRVRDYNEALDEIDKQIEGLEARTEAIQEAISEYNSAVGAAQDFVTEIRDNAQEYFDEKSPEWQAGETGKAGPAFQEWIEALEALPDLKEIDEAALELSDAFDLIGDDYRIEEDNLDAEENAAVIAEIPDGPQK
jgi:tetratricopeptide (TPR) repeat protein